jgi:hypothetical protein
MDPIIEVILWAALASLLFVGVVWLFWRHEP